MNVMTQKTDDITKVSKLLDNFSSGNGNTDSGINEICRESETGLKRSKGVLSNGEYILNGNNHYKGNVSYESNNYDNIKIKTFQTRQKRRKEVSSDGEYLSITEAEINFSSFSTVERVQNVPA